MPRQLCSTPSDRVYLLRQAPRRSGLGLSSYPALQDPGPHVNASQYTVNLGHGGIFFDTPQYAGHPGYGVMHSYPQNHAGNPWNAASVSVPHGVYVPPRGGPHTPKPIVRPQPKLRKRPTSRRQAEHKISQLHY